MKKLGREVSMFINHPLTYLIFTIGAVAETITPNSIKRRFGDNA